MKNKEKQKKNTAAIESSIAAVFFYMCKKEF
jgi:hypothetical protein